MSLRVIALIARTHLFAKKKQTLIASLGVTFGIAMFILMISVMTGVNHLLEDTSLASTPHIRIYHDIEARKSSILHEMLSGAQEMIVVHHTKPKAEQLNIKNGLSIARRIAADPLVLGVSPQLTSQVFYNYGPTQIPGSLAGVNILDEDQLYDIQSKMKSGKLTNLLTASDGIIMGKGLANKLNVQLGDKVTITTPYGVTMILRIVGIFKIGIGAIDNVKSYATISTVQKILHKDNRYITDIHIKLKDLNQAKQLAPAYEKLYSYKAEDWETANATIMASFVIRNIMTTIVVATLLIVAGFGIYNIMSMTVVDKMKDIAILKATGFGSSDIVNIFLLQAIIIGVMGSVLGMTIGFFLTYGISQLPFDGGEFLSVDTFPVNMSPLFYVFGLVFGIITTILAGFFPSRKASKVDPVVILRG